jgi:hypothetical protein
MSILGLLGVAFVVLKLCHVIAWSWWLVLLPFYGLFALLLVAWIGAQGLLGSINLLDAVLRKIRRWRKRPTMKFRGR